MPAEFPVLPKKWRLQILKKFCFLFTGWKWSKKKGAVKKWGFISSQLLFVMPRISPYRHFERKREVFFAGGQTVCACEPKWEAWYAKNAGYGVSCKRISVCIKKTAATKIPRLRSGWRYERRDSLTKAQDRVLRRGITLCGGVKDDEGRSFSACHFERKREVFFAGGQEETGEHRKMGNTVLHTFRDHGVSFGH